jgi:hypothetical protein
MKFKLSPEISYIIGVWKSRKTAEGIGIIGNDDITSVFLMKCVEAGLTTPNKVQIRENLVFFYHSKYRVFFQNIVKKRIDIYKFKNDYSSAYFAGRFDSSGGYNQDNNSVYLAKADKIDEMILLRLGFKVKLIKSKLIIIDTKKFLKFIEHYRNIKIPEQKVNK